MKNIHLKCKLITITNNFLKTVTSFFPKLFYIMILIILCLQQLSIASLAAVVNNTTQQYTFDNLATGNYEVYAVITDQANNQKVIGGDDNPAAADSGQINGTAAKTTPMPTLQKEDIHFAYAPTEWTSGQVTVTITDEHAAEHANLHLEYLECTSTEEVSGASHWEDLGKENTVKAQKNETICVRLTDDTNHSGYCTRNRC